MATAQWQYWLSSNYACVNSEVCCDILIDIIGMRSPFLFEWINLYAVLAKSAVQLTLVSMNSWAIEIRYAKYGKVAATCCAKKKSTYDIVSWGVIECSRVFLLVPHLVASKDESHPVYNVVFESTAISHEISSSAMLNNSTWSSKTCKCIERKSVKSKRYICNQQRDC